MGFWGDFQGLTEATGGGRGVKKFENWGDIVYGWSLILRKDVKNAEICSQRTYSSLPDNRVGW